MQKLTVAAIGAASLFALPVFAQNTTPSHNGSQATTNNSSSSTANLQQVQHKITQDLQNDGYTNVQVIPNSFLVHAMNKHNEPVVMIINPDSVFAVTQLPGNQANAGNPNGAHSSNQGVGSSGTNMPSKQ